MEIRGKVAIVTGSTRGIGRAIAESLVREGLNVCVSARDAEEIKRTVDELSDAGEIERVVDEVIAANPKQLEQYRAGKEALFGYFVGQVMKASQGKANPKLVNEVLRKKLQG